MIDFLKIKISDDADFDIDPWLDEDFGYPEVISYPDFFDFDDVESEE